MSDANRVDTALATLPARNPLRAAPSDARQRERRTLWVSILEGGFTSVFLTWTGGVVLTGYLLALGAGPRTLAAAASMPLLVQLFSPFMTWWAARQKRRTAYLQGATSLGRGLWIFAIFLPWWSHVGVPPALLLVALVGLSGFIQSGVGPAWISLMGDVVPGEIRGRYFGLRNGLLGIVTMAASLVAGAYLDRVPTPANFQMVLSVALVFALVGIVMYGWHEDPRHEAPRLSLLDAIRVPLRDAGFRRFIGFSMYWNAAVMLSSPFVIPYLLKHLEMSFTQVAIWSGIASLCTLGTAPMWGRLADHVGHKAVMAVTMVLVATVLPACWMMATPGFLIFIWISSVMDALGWGGVNTAMFNLSLHAAPARLRMTYLAVLGAAGGLTGCIAGLLSGPLLEWLMRWSVTVGTYEWTGYHSLFVLSGVMRLFAYRFLRGIPEPARRSLREVLREFTQRGASLLFQGRPVP